MGDPTTVQYDTPKEQSNHGIDILEYPIIYGYPQLVHWRNHTTSRLLKGVHNLVTRLRQGGKPWWFPAYNKHGYIQVYNKISEVLCTFSHAES